jgi:phosphoribosylaminoimidazole carboxylase PurE protein
MVAVPLVGVIMGSASYESVVQETLNTLEQLKIDYEVRVMSAHRTPERVQEYATTARDRGIQVLISADGGSAALGGVLASWTTLPVIGIPLTSSELNGWDSLLSTAQMPPGIPVACMAVGAWGARNAAFFAAEILGLQHEEIRQAYEDYRNQLRER